MRKDKARRFIVQVDIRIRSAYTYTFYVEYVAYTKFLIEKIRYT